MEFAVADMRHLPDSLRPGPALLRGLRMLHDGTVPPPPVAAVLDRYLAASARFVEDDRRLIARMSEPARPLGADVAALARYGLGGPPAATARALEAEARAVRGDLARSYATFVAMLEDDARAAWRRARVQWWLRRSLRGS